MGQYLRKLNSQTKKIADLDGFTGKFYQTFEEVFSRQSGRVLHKLSQKIEKKEHCATHFMRPALS